jgi:hypothetical protein
MARTDVIVPAIERIRDTGKIQGGLVGGWLPIVRFVYPEREGDWSELITFAPVRLELENPRRRPTCDPTFHSAR